MNEELTQDIFTKMIESDIKSVNDTYKSERDRLIVEDLLKTVLFRYRMYKRYGHLK